MGLINNTISQPYTTTNTVGVGRDGGGGQNGVLDFQARFPFGISSIRIVQYINLECVCQICLYLIIHAI